MIIKSDEREFKKLYSENTEKGYIWRFQNEFFRINGTCKKAKEVPPAGVGLHGPTIFALGETAVGTAGMVHARRNQKLKIFIKN